MLWSRPRTNWRRASSQIKSSAFFLTFYLESPRLFLVGDTPTWNIFSGNTITIMERPSMQIGHNRNDSTVYSDDSISVTEKEQLLGLLSSTDSPLRPSKSRVSRLRYVIALLFLSNAALLAAVLFLRRSNEVAPQKSWLPPESS